MTKNTKAIKTPQTPAMAGMAPMGWTKPKAKALSAKADDKVVELPTSEQPGLVQSALAKTAAGIAAEKTNGKGNARIATAKANAAKAAKAAPKGKAAKAEPKAEPKQASKREQARADAMDQARKGKMPTPPDFADHGSYRPLLAKMVELAKAGDAAGLKALTVEPKSNRRRKLCAYRDQVLAALAANRKG